MPPKKKLKPVVGQRSMMSFMKPRSETSETPAEATLTSTSVDLDQSGESEIIDNTSRPNTTTTGDNAVIIMETGRPYLWA